LGKCWDIGARYEIATGAPSEAIVQIELRKTHAALHISV
jgi:hypothetical protein